MDHVAPDAFVRVGAKAFWCQKQPGITEAAGTLPFASLRLAGRTKASAPTQPRFTPSALTG